MYLLHAPLNLHSNDANMIGLIQLLRRVFPSLKFKTMWKISFRRLKSLLFRWLNTTRAVQLSASCGEVQNTYSRKIYALYLPFIKFKHSFTWTVLWGQKAVNLTPIFISNISLPRVYLERLFYLSNTTILP